MVMDQTSVKLKKKMLVPHLLKIYFGLGWPSSVPNYDPCYPNNDPCYPNYDPCFSIYDPCYPIYDPCYPNYDPCYPNYDPSLPDQWAWSHERQGLLLPRTRW